MKTAAHVECAVNGVVIVAGHNFTNERDRFACVLCTAVGIGLAAGMDTGEIIRAVHEMLDRALEHNAEALEEIRRDGPGTIDYIGKV